MTHLIDGNVIVVNTRNALKQEREKEFGIVQQTACRFNCHPQAVIPGRTHPHLPRHC